jgi:Golgi phosphoprotein 3
MLTLSEELFLLSLQEKKGAVKFNNTIELPYALAGALLFELFLAGKVRLEGKKVAAVGRVLASTELLNEMLEKISAGQPKKIAHWVEVFGGKDRKLRKTVVDGLVVKGILKEEEKILLWVIPYTGYAEQDTSAKFALKQRLRGVVLGGQPAGERDTALLSLVLAGGLLDHLFTRDELRRAKKVVEDLVESDAVGQAVTETIEAINAAVMTAVMVATSG